MNELSRIILSHGMPRPGKPRLGSAMSIKGLLSLLPWLQGPRFLMSWIMSSPSLMMGKAAPFVQSAQSGGVPAADSVSATNASHEPAHLPRTEFSPSALTVRNSDDPGLCSLPNGLCVGTHQVGPTLLLRLWVFRPVRRSPMSTVPS